MANDITMCTGYDCPKKERCYRYKAIPSEIDQLYFTRKPYIKSRGEIVCGMFWKM